MGRPGPDVVEAVVKVGSTAFSPALGPTPGGVLTVPSPLPFAVIGYVSGFDRTVEGS